jgi:hypothetical protein
MTAPIVFDLDGRTFDAGRVDQTITVGTTEEWTLVNKDVFQHPFHIHVNPFQVIKVNNEDYPEPEVWWDTFALPPKGSVTLRMRFRPDVTGKTVFHCHILPHEDLGMMQLINLVSPGGPVIAPKGPFSTGEPIPPPGRPSFKPLPARPYVFTHLYPPIARHMALHDAKVAGHGIEVQLPSEPTGWTTSIDGDSVRPNGRTQVFTSIGQYDGESAIDAFKFKAAEPGCATLTLSGAPSPLSWLENPIAITFAAVEGKVRGQPGECAAP